MIWLLIISLGLIFLGLTVAIWSGQRQKKMLEEQRREAVRTKRMIEELFLTEGWKLLATTAQSQVNTRRGLINFKAATDPLEQEFVKGEAHGIELFLRIPNALLDEAKTIIELSNKEGDE